MAQLLLIVARERPDLFSFAKREFAEEEEVGRVQIVLDRRQDPRQRTQPAETELSPGYRRCQSDIDVELRTLGWAITRRENPVD